MFSLLATLIATASVLTEADAVARAMGGNRELQALRRRAEVSSMRAADAQVRPAPELKYEQWGTPLNAPWRLDQSEMLMLGVSKTFLPSGAFDARSRSATAEAAGASAAIGTRAEELAAAVHDAFAELALAVDEAAVHEEHITIAMRLTDSARALTASGRVAVEDVVRITAEMARLHAAQLAVARRADAANIRLRLLMGLEPAEALPKAQPDSMEDLVSRAAKARAAGIDRRPELAVGRHAIEARRAEAEAARIDADSPMFMAGLDYMYVPMNVPTEHGAEAKSPHAYGVMASMSLPWLNPGRDAPARRAEAEAEAERLVLEATRVAIEAELAEAASRFEGALEAIQSLDRDVLPKETQALDVSRGSYASGSGNLLGVLDALRTSADVRLERAGAMQQLRGAVVRLERAAGLTRGEGSR